MVSTNTTLRKSAAKAIKTLEHARVSLWERCGGIETLNALVAKGVKIYALTLEASFDLGSQTSSAFSHIMQHMRHTKSVWRNTTGIEKTYLERANKFFTQAINKTIPTACDD